jgi:hypothetical protein
VQNPRGAFVQSASVLQGSVAMLGVTVVQVFVRGNVFGQSTTDVRCTARPPHETKPVSVLPTRSGLGSAQERNMPELAAPDSPPLLPPLPVAPLLPAVAATHRPFTHTVPGQPKQSVCGQSALVLQSVPVAPPVAEPPALPDAPPAPLARPPALGEPPELVEPPDVPASCAVPVAPPPSLPLQAPSSNENTYSAPIRSCITSYPRMGLQSNHRTPAHNPPFHTLERIASGPFCAKTRVLSSVRCNAAGLTPRAESNSLPCAPTRGLSLGTSWASRKDAGQRDLEYSIGHVYCSMHRMASVPSFVILGVAGILAAMACSSSSGGGTSSDGGSVPTTGGSMGASGAASGGSADSASGGTTGSAGTTASTGAMGAGATSGMECKTTADCPQTNCFGCPGTVCLNGQCVAAGGGSGGTSSGGTSGRGTSGNGGASAGETGTGGRNGSDAGDGGGKGSARPCTTPMAIHVSNGPQTSAGDTGFDECGSSWVARRRVAVACPLGPTTTDANQCSPSYCRSDADCSKQPHGFCSEARHLAGYCGCFYGCMQDSDCDAGNVCFCGTPVGHCVPATCKDDTTCSQGNLCASYLAPCVPGMLTSGGACTGAVNGCFSGFACQTPSDECLYDTDCLPNNGRCELHGDHRVCAPTCPGPPPPTP